jgi:hypothetical protein
LDLNISESYSQEEIQKLAEAVADRYCYNGDYDCNCSYWDNIDNLVTEELHMDSICRE